MPPKVELGKIFTRENAWKATSGTFKIAAGTTLYLATGLPLIAPLGLAWKIHKSSEERRRLGMGWEYYAQKFAGYKHLVTSFAPEIGETLKSMAHDREMLLATGLGVTFGAASIATSEILTRALPVPHDLSRYLTRLLITRAAPHVVPRMIYGLLAVAGGENPNKTDERFLNRLNTVSQIAATVTTLSMARDFKLNHFLGDNPNAANIDLDTDGIPDAKEIELFGNTTTAGIGTDFDGDGIPDTQELINGTDPIIRNSIDSSAPLPVQTIQPEIDPDKCFNHAFFSKNPKIVEDGWTLGFTNNNSSHVAQDPLVYLDNNGFPDGVADDNDLIFLGDHANLGHVYIKTGEKIVDHINLYNDKGILVGQDWSGDFKADIIVDHFKEGIIANGADPDGNGVSNLGTLTSQDGRPLEFENFDGKEYVLTCNGWELAHGQESATAIIPKPTETPLPTMLPTETPILPTETPTLTPEPSPTLVPESTPTPLAEISEQRDLHGLLLTTKDVDGNGTIDIVNLKYPDGTSIDTEWIDTNGDGKISYGDLIRAKGGIDLDGDGNIEQPIYLKVDAEGSLSPYQRVNGLAYPAAQNPDETDAKNILYNSKGEEIGRDWNGDFVADEAKVTNGQGQEVWVVDANKDGKMDEVVLNRAVHVKGFPARVLGTDGMIYQDNNFDGRYETTIAQDGTISHDLDGDGQFETVTKPTTPQNTTQPTNNVTHFGSTKVLGPKGGIFGLVAQRFVNEGYDADLNNADQLTYGVASEINHKFFLAVEEMKAHGISHEEIAKVWYEPRGIAMVYPTDDSVYDVAKRLGIDDEEIDKIFSKYGLAV